MKLTGKTNLLVLSVALAITTTVASAGAEERLEPEQPVYERFRQNLVHRHDRGLMFRAELGAGFVAVSEDEHLSSSGAGVLGAVAVGWLPWQQIALHLNGWAIVGRRIGWLGIGPGATYWFGDGTGPWFVSGAIGFVTTGDGAWFRQNAIGTELQAGAYGWVGSQSTMGISLVAGAEGIDVDADGTVREGWRVGLRVGVEFE